MAKGAGWLKRPNLIFEAIVSYSAMMVVRRSFINFIIIALIMLKYFLLFVSKWSVLKFSCWNTNLIKQSFLNDCFYSYKLYTLQHSYKWVRKISSFVTILVIKVLMVMSISILKWTQKGNLNTLTTLNTKVILSSAKKVQKHLFLVYVSATILQ